MDKFIFVLDNFDKGGGERIVYGLIEKLSKNYNIFVYSSQSSSNQLIKNITINNHNLFSKIINIYKVLYNSKNGIVIISFSGEIIIAGIINLIFKRNLIAYEHSNLKEFYLNQKFSNFFYIKKFLYKIARKKINQIIYSSEQAKIDSESLFNKKINSYYLTPYFNSFSKKLMDVEIKNEICFFIIGRNSREKNLTHFLSNKILYNHKKIIVSDIKKKDEFHFNKFNNVEIYSNINQIKIFYKYPVLLNSCLIESYGIVIAEWLSSNYIILSDYSENLNKLWNQYRGFYFFNDNKDNLINLIYSFYKGGYDNRQKLIPKNIDIFTNQFLDICNKNKL